MNGLSIARRVRLALVAIVIAQTAMAATAAAIAAGWIAAAVVAVALAWRARTVRSLERAALWVEERDTSLQYELVTAVDPRYEGRGANAAPSRLLRRAALRALWPAAVALLLAVGLRAAAGPLRHWWRHTAGLGGRNARVISRLTPLTAHVVPPAYSHRSAFDVREPSGVTSLVGSVVSIRGPGDATGLAATVAGQGVVVGTDNDGGWQASMPMPATAAVVRVVDGTASRLIVLTPVPDAPPTVELTAPTRDSTLRSADARVPLVAHATDDIGLADGYFEIIITGGEEETGGVRGRTLAIGRASLSDARTATLSATLAFGTLGLHPGDVVSIRAIARDGNVVTGPGVGSSDTRTFRLATPQEYDTTNVTPAPPSAADSAYMTQRMIVIATRALLDRMRSRPPVRRDTVVTASAHLADRQEALRARVYELITSDASMPGAERMLFDTAYAAMTDASNSLEIAEPKEALPREMRALSALDSIRAMQRRYYLRGQPPTIVVNISRVRMTGTEKPSVGLRMPATPFDTVSRRLAASLSRLRGPAMADSLALMQVAAYGVNPVLAASLGDAATALRAGHDPTPALLRARRLLDAPARADTAQTTGWVAP